MKPTADLILQNGRITTLDPSHPSATEVVIAGDKLAGVDNAAEFERGPQTKVIYLKGRRVIPGLYDSHLHVIRGGLNYNMELRWEGVPSLSLALQCCASRRLEHPRRNGCGWLEGGLNFSLSNGGCPRWEIRSGIEDAEKESQAELPPRQLAQESLNPASDLC